MNPSRLFILRPVATSLLMVAILLAGAVAYYQLPVSALPQVDYPTIQVLTFYPGASPDVVASAITAPLERQFGQVPGLKQMTSISSAGSSVITLQFTLELNIDVAQQDVQAAINAATTYLPRDLPNPPIYSKVNPADAPILTLALTSTTLPLAQVEDLADTRLVQKISQLPGVGLVSISGGQKPAVRVQANPTALGSYGLTLEDLRVAIAQANIIDSAENVKLAAWMNAVPAVIVNVQRQPGANIIKVVDSIKELLPKLKASLPSAVEVAILTDRTTTIRASVEDVQFTLMLAIALIVMVMFLFVRTLAATVIPSVAVPVSLVGTFGVMYLLGYSLNNLSLMALTIATGFVIDDAIVMIENIVRYIEEGDPPMQAALKGAEQIGFTILSLTVSLIAVLIPLLFMGDIVGRLFREFAVTLSVTILVSAVVSLTLTPMMCARMLRHKPESEQGWFYRTSEHAFNSIIAFYGLTLRWVLRHRVATLIVAMATLVTTVWLYIFVPKGFFPVQDTGVILGISEAPQTVCFAAMADRQQALARVILQDHAVESLSSFIGVDGTNATVNSGRIQINLKPLDERHVSAVEIIRRLQPELATVEGITLFLQPVQDLTVEDRVSRTQYQYSLEDPDPKELSLWTPRFVRKLQELPQLRDVASDDQNLGLQARLVIDRDTASRFGIRPQTIDDTLYDAFGQRQISTIFTQSNQYRVVLEVKPQFQDSLEDLQHIRLRSAAGGQAPLSTATGQGAFGTAGGQAAVSAQVPLSAAGGQVPLSALARVETSTAPLSISHQGQFPVVTVSFNLTPGVSLGDAVRAIDEAKQELGLPASLEAGFQGTAKAFQASLTNAPLLILAALVTVYIILGVLYESYIHPLTILSTLPSAGVGALLALLLCRTDLNVIALIGMILLIGIVQKNGIMMIDFALDAERREGKQPLDAIYQACLLRFRPILMTTMAAILGGVPLALGTGTGSELRRPLGIAIVGGLMFSQVLTLYTTPVIYLAFDRLAKRVSTRRGGRPVPHPAPVEAA